MTEAPVSFSSAAASGASIFDLVGNTPLVRLRGPSAETKCDIFGKAEFMNPGGSVKDRAARAILLDAENQGLLKPGSLVVEGTAGNTGISLALLGRARGYRTLVVIPETQSEEKKRLLRAVGALCLEVPAVPYKNPGNYVRVSEKIAAERHGFWANQFDNQANRRAHLEETGPEILAQCGNQLDGFACAVGSGGSLAGIGLALQRALPHCKIALADPQGSALASYYRDGVLQSEGQSITEGIGQGRETQNLVGFQPDFAWTIPDQEALNWCYRLADEEGLFLGGSAGVNVAGAVRLAHALGPKKRIVTLLCDSGERYLGKIYNADFLTARGLSVPDWLVRSSGAGEQAPSDSRGPV